jgi:hypothetical protein
MTTAACIVAVALAVAAGRLILWTSLGRGSAFASALEAVRDAAGVLEYCVAPLGIGCRGHVVVRHTRMGELGRELLMRLRGLEPFEVVELLREEGLRAELMPGVEGAMSAGAAPALAMSTARPRGRIAD